MEPTCSTCRYYQTKKGYVNMGICKRFPPKTGEERSWIGNLPVFLEMNSMDWCGEWKIDQSEHDLKITRWRELVDIPWEKRTEENQKEIDDLSLWFTLMEAQ